MKRFLLPLCLFAYSFAQELPQVDSFEEVSEPIVVPEIHLPKKDPGLAVSLSTLFPGLGHFYLDDSKTASAFMSAASMELGAFAYALNDGHEEAATFSLLTFVNTMNYSLYAAYRDARGCNGQEFYRCKMPMESLSELASSPFRWGVLKKPEVWGGCLGALAIACVVNYFAFPSDARISPMTFLEGDKISPWFPAIALPVGIGEESLFRGVIQSRFREAFGPWTSITMTSLLFGAAHIPNAFLLPEEEQWRYYAFSLPLITTFSLYLGWLTEKNISLKESVALHTWYDLVLFSAAAAAQSAVIGRPVISFAIPF